MQIAKSPTPTTPPEQVAFMLDRRHLAERDRGTWRIRLKDVGGVYRTIDEWRGTRRSIFQWLERNQITASRAAEEQINALSEQPAFRDDAEKRGQMPTVAV